jgi:LysM repeat protein
MSAPSRLITLTPDPTANNSVGNSNAYNPVTASLVDNAKYGPISSGGWQVVDRPKQVAATQWFDRPPFQLEMDLILDGSATNYPNKSYSQQIKFAPTVAFDVNGNAIVGPTENAYSVEEACSQLEKWLEAVPTLREPPNITVSGPVPGTQRTWILYSIDFSEAIRDFSTGVRVQQQLKVVLYEYNSPLVSTNSAANTSPAATAQKPPKATKSPSYTIHTVVKGETLLSIAGKKGYAYANKIAALNNIRDPKTIFPGQKLKMPA